jgi:hypothetical protein
MMAISKTFMTVDTDINPGDTLQLNVAANLRDSSGVEVTPVDTDLGEMYHVTVVATPILITEVTGSTDISGFNISTSTSPNSVSGVTRTYI